MAIQGFNKEFYLNAKLAQLQNNAETAADWAGKDAAFLEERLETGFGLTAEQHYEQFGYKEDLAPNEFFNPAEYIRAKAVALFNDPATSYLSVDAAAEDFVNLWGGNVYNHYLQFGEKEGVNPSNSFDVSGYYEAKLAQLQAAGNTEITSVDQVKEAFEAAGLTALEHFLTYGQTEEGLSAPAVPADEQVNVDTSVPGQVFTLTAGADNLTGTANDDTFNAAAVAPTGTEAPTLTVGDSIDGGLGNDTLKVTQSAAISVPTGVTVQNVETLTLLSGNEINVNTASGFSGLTTLNATSDSDGGSTNLTAATTTDVNSTELDLQASGTSQLVINGGKGVTVNASGTTTQATALNTSTGANAEILVGATTAAAGKVNVTNSFKGADGQTSGDVFVKGGTEVSVTQTLTNSTVNETNVQGDVAVVGDANTTAVTVNQDATAVKSNTGTGVVGKTAGDVTVTDKNAASNTDAGSITTVSLKNAGAATINSSALTTLNLEGTLTSVNAGTLGALTTPANTSLALNLTGAKSTGTVSIDSYIKTLNVSGNTTASTLDTLSAGGATKINVSGDAKVTFTNNTTAAVTDIVVTNTGGAAFGTAIGAGVNFTGGAGDDAVKLSDTFTKAITMGAGDDTVTYGGAAGTGGSVAAGDGNDTIVMTDSQAAAADGNSTFNTTFTGFETLQISDAFVENSLNLDGLNGVSKVILANTTSSIDSEAGITNLVSGGTVKLASGGINTPVLNVGIKGALLSDSDIFNLELSSSSVLGAGEVNVDNVETINIDVADAAAAGSNAVTHTLDLDATAAKSVTVSGNNGLTLTNTGNTKITNFDASGVVANNTAAGAGVAATTDTAANLAVTFASANNTAGDTVTIKGGEGNDILTGNISKDVITGGAGNDAIYADNQGTKEIQTIGAATANASSASTVDVTVYGIEVTTTSIAAGGTANAVATAIKTAIEGNADLAKLVSVAVDGSDNVVVTSLVDGDAPAITVTPSAAFASGGSVTETTKGTAGTTAIDTLNGGEGADLLVGGGGADSITTGGGADTVFFLQGHSNKASIATIEDFNYEVGGTANDKIVLGDVATKAGTVAKVQDFSGQASLDAAFDAAAAANTVDNGLSVFIHGGNTYAYVESTGATATYQASDFAVKLVGTQFAADTALTGLGFDAV